MNKPDPARLGETRSIPVRFLESVKLWIGRTFAYREILLRSSDHVHYVRLTPRRQKAAAALLIVGLGWGGYITAGYIAQQNELAEREREIARSQAAYGDLLAEVARYQRHFASITRDLETAQQRLLTQLESEGVAQTPALRAERDHQAAELRARMVVAQDELRSQLEALGLDLKDVLRRNSSLKERIHNLQLTLTETEAERAEAKEARQRVGRVLSETEMALARERSEKAEANSTVATLQAQLADWKKRYAALGHAKDALAEERDLLGAKVTSERSAAALLERKVEGLQTALLEARGAVDRADGAREALAGKLEGVKGELAQALAERDVLEQRLAGEAKRLADAQERIDTLEQRRASLQRGAERLAGALRASTARNEELDKRAAELGQSVEQANNEIETLKVERKTQRKRIDRLAGSLDGSREEVAELQAQLHGVTRTLDGADRKAEALAEQRDLLRARLAEARGALAEQAERHAAVIQRLSDRTSQSIDTMEELLALTGLDIESMVDEASIKAAGDGKGGPFLPYRDLPDRPHLDHPNASLGTLDSRVRRWEALQMVLAATPLGTPLTANFRISSQFGKRRDPLNGKLSRHEGLDLAAAYRSPVLATAPGTVSFAGWMSGYGRVIEIDHGFGITTRYAHLRRIDVEVGKPVAFHEKIGQLGNSGRSTGAHVHYEVRYNDKPLNPLKFMKAASHVLKG